MAVSLFDWGEAKLDEVMSGAHVAPVPEVTTSPPSAVQPKAWTAPDVGGRNHLEVHPGVLHDASAVVRNHLSQLDQAISRARSHSSAFDSLMISATGAAFGANLATAAEGFATVGQQTSGVHADHARNLSSAADAYDAAETASVRSVSKVGSQLSAGGPGSGADLPASAKASNGNWG